MVLRCRKWNLHPDKTAAYAAWTQRCRVANFALANDVTTELWGPSPIVPQPIRPGG